MAATAIARARRRRPQLGTAGRDVVVLAADGGGYAGRDRPADTGLVVMSGRPSTVQAAIALMLGADAYLPFDHDAAETAAAIDRVTRSRLHIEPETAAALHVLASFAAWAPAASTATGLNLALRLRSRGWQWRDALASAGVDAGTADRSLQRLLHRMRGGEHERSSP
jgi:hypothetical protein